MDYQHTTIEDKTVHPNLFVHGYTDLIEQTFVVAESYYSRHQPAVAVSSLVHGVSGHFFSVEARIIEYLLQDASRSVQA